MGWLEIIFSRSTYAYAYDNNLYSIFDSNIKQVESSFEYRDSYWDTIFSNILKESVSKLNSYNILDLNKPFINDKYPDFEYVKIKKKMHNMNVKLCGYFQSYKYFHHLRSKIIDLLKPNNIINEKLNFYINNIVKNNTRYTVSLHVRRGDYLKLSEFHRILPIEYYINAIKYFTPEHTFVVFSDDIEWCKINLSEYLNKVVFIEDKDYIELYLSSLST